MAYLIGITDPHRSNSIFPAVCDGVSNRGHRPHWNSSISQPSVTASKKPAMRQFFPDVFYFITTPTVDHCRFFNTDAKKDILLESILIAQKKFNFKNFDFSLLDNHYHLIGFFEDSNIIPQVIKQINGRSGKLLNQFEHIKNRKIWSDYHIYYVGHESVYYKVRGYVIGNAYKHNKISSLKALASYPYSTYGNIIKELGQEQAEDIVLAGVKMSEQDFVNKNNLIR